jgi:hypothetical protein
MGSTTTSAPRKARSFSVWSRAASLSITVVRPGELRPARRIADLICAEATGVRYSIGVGSAVPWMTIGQRPPSACSTTSTPISASGSRMRRIGRLRSEASPSKRARIGWPPTTPSISREPVPALPKSSVSRGASSVPMPTPWTTQASASRVIVAPSARAAAAVRITSSPSSRPVTRVVPTVSRPKIIARCEIDLSPGGRRRPRSGVPLVAVNGLVSDACDDTVILCCRRKGDDARGRSMAARGLSSERRRCRANFAFDTRRARH